MSWPIACISRWLRWWPISSTAQMLFAEALSQALATGIELSDAIAIAARINPSRRFREALEEMVRSCRSGYSLEISLSRTGTRVRDGLLAALEVGEEQGDLVAALSAFARSIDPQAAVRLRRAAGRPVEVARFAAALARLLEDRRLTRELIEDAGRLAAEGNERFRGVIRQVSQAMQNGESFPASLARHPSWFDTLFCRCMETVMSRSAMRSALSRLAAESASAERSGQMRVLKE